jgi:hypothetical protein
MTLIELSVVLSTITGAIGGGLAGGRGGFLFGAAGTAGGAIAGMMAAVLTAAVTGLIVVGLGGANDPPVRHPPGRLSEFAFFLFISPLGFAPVWVPFLTYRLVGLFLAHS